MMGHSNPGSWTAERIALFDQIHAQSPKAIWTAVNALPGPQLTKSAVIGRRDRAHGMVRRPVRTQEEIAASLLARRNRENAKQREKRAANSGKNVVNFNRRAAAKERAANGGDPGPYICIEAKDIAPLNITIDQLDETKCRYPFGDGPFTFCGHLPKDGSPYCAPHHRICYQGIPERRQTLHPAEFGKNRGGVFGRVA